MHHSEDDAVAMADTRLVNIGGPRIGWTINQDAHVAETRTLSGYQIISASSVPFNEFVTWIGDDSENEESSSELRVFFDTVYDLAKRGKEDYAIDVIFECFDKLLIDEQFDVCDLILAEVALARIPPVLMVSFLTITAAAKSKLQNRDKFFKDVRQLVAKQRGEKAADRLLDGLE